MKAATISGDGAGASEKFQSTPPVKAATGSRLTVCCVRTISIHAAREGGDKKAISHIGFYVGFQSTPPVKAATVAAKFKIRQRGISIHAAREGGD